MTGLEAEITLAEHDADRVRPGQPVALRTRASSIRTFHGRVDRIAPVAVPGEVQSTAPAYCRLEEVTPGVATRDGRAMPASPPAGR